MSHAVKSLRKVSCTGIVCCFNSKCRRISSETLRDQCSETSKTRLKRQNKNIATAVLVHHLHTHNVLKSLCEDRKDTYDMIIQLFCKGVSIENWDDVEHLPDKRRYRKSKENIETCVSPGIFPIQTATHISSA
jgi:hypothetical protein